MGEQVEAGWDIENACAEEHGFLPVPDPTRGAGWCKFVKGDVSVWRVRDGWRWARCVRDRYQDHRTFRVLKDAVSHAV